MSAATPLANSQSVIERPDAEVIVIEQRLDPLVRRAESMSVTDVESLNRAGSFLRDCKAMEDEIRATLDPGVKKAHELHRELTGVRGKLLAPVERASRLVKDKVAGFELAERRRLDEERQQREAELRAAEVDRRIEAAADLEARGEAEAAEELLDAPIAVPLVPAAPVARTEGVSARMKYSAEVVDLKALVRAAAEGRVPEGLLLPNQKALDALASSLKEGLSIPGVTVRKSAVVAVRGR